MKPARAEDTELPGNVLEAERAVLAACLLGDQALERASEVLTPASFFRSAHQEFFRAMLALHRAGRPVDTVTLCEQLRQDESLDRIGGGAAIAQLMEYATTTANVVAHARIVAAQHARREARRAVRALEAATLNGEPLAAAIATCSSALEAARALEDSSLSRPPTLVEQILTDETLQSAELSPAADLIGRRYIVEGGMTILVGQSGLGKTFLAIQMMRSLATATPWLGHHALQGRSALLELEMPAWSIRERLARSYGGAMDILAMPQGFTQLPDPAILKQMVRWISERQVRLLVADPVHAMHQANENYGTELNPFMAALMKLRSETGVHVVLIHHVNKLDFDKELGLQMSVMRAVRGAGRLVNDPDNVLGVVRWHGRILLVNAKCRFGPQPESITIRQLDRFAPAGEQGFFELATSEEEQADVNQAKVEKALGFNPKGASLDKLCELTELSHNTVTRYLGILGAVRIKDGRTYLWFPQDPRDGQGSFDA